MSTPNNRRRDTDTLTTPQMTTLPTTAQNAYLPMPGASVYPRNGAVNVRRDSSTTAPVLNQYPREIKIGTYTGTSEKKVDGTWLKLSILGGYGWVRSDVVIVVNPTAKTPTKQEIDGVVQQLQKSDEEIFHTLLRALPLMQAAKAKGVNVAAHETKYKDLYNRFSVRQTAMKESTALKCQTGVRKTYEAMRDKMASWLGIHGIGEPFTLATCVILVAVGVGASVAVYYVFKPKYDESSKDLVISSDLEKALSTLSPEVRETVVKDLEKQVDDAYNQGKTDGTFGGLGKVFMYGGFGLLAVYGINQLTKSSKQ